MQRTRWVAVAVLAAVGLLAGCTGDDGGVEPIDTANTGADPVEDDAGTEVVEEPEAEEDTDLEDEAAEPAESEIDISVVPDEITLEYVDAVLVELERLFADSVRAVVESQEMTIVASDLVNSAFGGAERDSVFADLLAIVEQPDLVRDVEEITPNTYTAHRLLDKSDGCLWVETVADLSGVFVGAPEPRPTFVLLRVQDTEYHIDPNPTPWVYRAIRVDADDELRAETPCSR